MCFSAKKQLKNILKQKSFCFLWYRLDGNNLYCSGFESCSYSRSISNFTNVYSYAYWGTSNSIIENIRNNVFCTDLASCSASNITNVQGNVYSLGYHSNSFGILTMCNFQDLVQEYFEDQYFQ